MYLAHDIYTLWVWVFIAPYYKQGSAFDDDGVRSGIILFIQSCMTDNALHQLSVLLHECTVNAISDSTPQFCSSHSIIA